MSVFFSKLRMGPHARRLRTLTARATRSGSRSCCLLLTGAIALAAAAVVSHAQQALAPDTDWPQWRGPSRDGSVGAALPTRWPEALKKRWEIPVGTGHASPV